MTPIQSLIDQHRNLMAQAAGVQIRICMALGDREGAARAQAEMYAYVAARRAAREAGLVGRCEFADMADEIKAGVPVDEAVCGVTQ
jgi:hypothetical protein